MGNPERHYGLELKRARASCGISQEELGGRAEIHLSYVSQLERGMKSPSLGVMLRIGKALNRPASEMLRAVEQELDACPKGGGKR